MESNKANIDLMTITGQQQSRIEHASMQVNSYKIRLNDDIIEPSAYTDELNLIENLGENDSVTIVLNNGGGHLDTAIEFCSAIEGTGGTVHGHISGACHSAASMIFLKCHSFSLSKYASMLIHKASGGFSGQIPDVFKHVDHFKEWIEFFYKDVYRDFLTEEEIESVLDGKDIWLNADQIEERLERMCEARKSRADSEAEEFLEPELEVLEESGESDEDGQDEIDPEDQVVPNRNKRCDGWEDCDCNIWLNRDAVE